MGTHRKLLWIVPALAAVSCQKSTLVPYDLEGPPVVRTPTRQVGITDDRIRFRQIFCERFAALRDLDAGVPDDATCGDYLHKLGGEGRAPPGPMGAFGGGLAIDRLHVRIVPGYLGDGAPNGMLPFGPAVDRLRTQGYDIEYVTVTGGGSSGQNAAMIAETLSRLPVPDDDVLLLIGYSKGTIDIMHFLVGFPDLARTVDAVLSVSGAINGSPLADAVPDSLVDLLVTLGEGEAGDHGGFDSLKPSVQVPWMATHRLPEHVRYFSLVSFTDRWNVSSILRGSWDNLSEVDPRNDGMVLYHDQVIPRGTILGYVNGDHWAVALPFTDQAAALADTLMDHNDFPRTALLESMLIYVREQFAE